MIIDGYHFTKRFLKRFTDLPPGKQIKVTQALTLAVADPYDPSLRLHALKGEYAGTYSISAGGDLRIHFEMTDKDGESIASLQSVGTHSQLYG